MCKGSYFELVICGWAIYFREPGCPQQSSRLVKCSQSQTLKLTNLESLAVIQTSVKVTPSTHPRYIDIFTRPSNTPELWKINMIWLLGHTTTAVSSTVCYIYTYTPRSLKSQPSFPWKVNSSYTFCLHWCVLSWDRWRSLNANETHLSTTPLKLCVLPALDMQCLFSTIVSGSLEAGW